MVKPSAVGLGEEVPLKSMGVMHGSVLSNTAASKGNGHSIQEVGSSGTSSNVRKRPGMCALFPLSWRHVNSEHSGLGTECGCFHFPGGCCVDPHPSPPREHCGRIFRPCWDQCNVSVSVGGHKQSPFWASWMESASVPPLPSLPPNCSLHFF